MTLLSTLYASAPSDEVLIPTLEIDHPSFETIRTCAGFEDRHASAQEHIESMGLSLVPSEEEV